MQSTSQSTYGAPARVFHWATALLLAGQYAIGWAMPDVHRDTKPTGLIAWHLSVGVLIVLLVVVRVLWRTSRPAPSEQEGVPPVLALIARLTHWLLYLLLIALPLMGWANASSRGWPVALAGLIPMPSLSAAGSPIGHALGDWHKVFAWVLLALVGLHVAAALFHHFILRDGTLRRMLPRIRDRA